MIEQIDGITVINNKGDIVFHAKYNPRFNKVNTSLKVCDKNLFELYPGLQPEDSTLIECIKNGKFIYRKNQKFYDYSGNLINTDNITIPIVKSGKVIGAIELSKDITSINDLTCDDNAKTSGKYQSIKTKIPFTFDSIVTQDEGMLESIKKAKTIADSTSPVLIYGETGTGKELFAQSIYNYSSRRGKPFVTQNCAALPESLFESILFGTVSGAFTGACNKPGLFEIADGGTLYLDEINSMPLNLQSKLLRVLQDQEIRKLGDTKAKKVDVRVVTSMNVNPTEAVQQNILRKDLFYRLNVISIKLPPLRERRCDIPILVDFFINKYNDAFKHNVKGISKEVYDAFEICSWDGNVRELEHVIEAAINIVEDGYIHLKDLPVYLIDEIEKEMTNSDEQTDANGQTNMQSLEQIVNQVEKKMIMKYIKSCGGNISKAAKFLNIPRQTLQYKIQKYNIKINA